MKSRAIIMQDFSIAGIKKQWEWQQSDYIVKHGMKGGPIEGQEHHFKKIKGLFHPEQVGCKSVTRRLTRLKEVNTNPNNYKCKIINEGGELFACFYDDGEKLSGRTNRVLYDGLAQLIHKIKCPYGVPGDELWVAEKFDKADTPSGKVYAYYDTPVGIVGKRKFKSPRYMPREASRITLLIESIGVERLHDITEESAMREGITLDGMASSHGHLNYRMAFAIRWTDLHDNYNLNPWVWVIKFSVKEFKNV